MSPLHFALQLGEINMTTQTSYVATGPLYRYW